MKVLFYLPANGKTRQKFEKEVVALVPTDRRECYQTIETFSQRLRRCGGFPMIAVVMAAREKDLLDILSIRHFLSDVRLILILPNSDKSTIALGHTFYPRFLDFITGDFSRVAAVMNKMMGYVSFKANFGVDRHLGDLTKLV